MVDTSYQNYWTLVTAHRRRGSEGALKGLRLMSHGVGKSAALAKTYVMKLEQENGTN